MSVSNRAHLIRLLHIEQLIIKDQESGSNLQTLLEVITKQLLYPNQQAVHTSEKVLPALKKIHIDDAYWSSENVSHSSNKCKQDSEWNIITTAFDNLKNAEKRKELQMENRLYTDMNSVESMSNHFDDLEVSDVTDADEDDGAWEQSLHHKKSWASSVISRSLTMDLKRLLFGTGSPVNSFSDDWRGQAFTFNSHISYGFLQRKGGPCGLLAAVQAKLLLKLLFKDKLTRLKNDHKLFVTCNQRNEALATTLAEILWQAGLEKTAVVAMASQLVSNKGILESLSLYSFTNLEDLMDYFHSTVKMWENEGCDSCISFLCSILLSRGLNNVRGDMDDPSNSIIGRHGYCTLEMVNLLLQGCAFSNVFDGDVSLNGMELHGIQKTSEIGFLSLFEHYNTCQVGEFYKSPHYPLWVVLSESHFTVLFSTKYLNESMKTFDLFYYDSLGRQETEIWLTLDLHCDSLDTQENRSESDMTPPLELCIRTKWKNANIQWNGSEPLL